MKSIKHVIIVATILILTIGQQGCMKADYQRESILRMLYNAYRDGEISECKYNGQTVYCAIENGHDFGSVIYDINQNILGTCNYAWGKPDSICNQLKDCETIYRVKDNIWGQPAVDKYGLGK